MSITLPPVITVDGPGGSGKGALTYGLASQLGWHLLDSGALYRIVAVAADARGVHYSDGAALAAIAENLSVKFEPDQDVPEVAIIYEAKDISRLVRLEETGKSASLISVLAPVRAALLTRQRDFRMPPGLVADGRDMGTVVFPDAALKIFLTATPEERANRRYKQLKQKGFDVSLRDLFRDIQERDERDASRAESPLVPATDAVVIDSTAYTLKEVLEKVVAIARERELCK